MVGRWRGHYRGDGYHLQTDAGRCGQGHHGGGQLYGCTGWQRVQGQCGHHGGGRRQRGRHRHRDDQWHRDPELNAHGCQHAGRYRRYGPCELPVVGRWRGHYRGDDCHLHPDPSPGGQGHHGGGQLYGCTGWQRVQGQCGHHGGGQRQRRRHRHRDDQWHRHPELNAHGCQHTGRHRRYGPCELPVVCWNHRHCGGHWTDLDPGPSGSGQGDQSSGQLHRQL